MNDGLSTLTEEPGHAAFQLEDRNRVELCIPGRLEFVPIVRVTVSGYATRMGFDIDEVEDLRIAVDELTSILIDTSSPQSVTLTLETDGTKLRMRGTVTGGDAVEMPEIDRITEQILGAVVDEYQLVVHEATLAFTASRRRSPGA